MCEDDVNNSSPRNLDHDGRIDNESSRPSTSLQQNTTSQQKKFPSGSLLPDNFLFPKMVVTDGDR